jgi:hypothetical protein
MSKKHAIAFAGIAVGLLGAAAASHWSNFAAPIQMAMYSVMIVGLLLVGVWSDRRRPRFAIAICSMLAVHGIVLFTMRGLFPFRTILVVLPLALIEGTILFILLLKVLGDGRAGSDI